MIEINSVSKSWDDGKSFVVKNVSLTVPRGQVLALLGGSGSGKSTTVKMINRLIEPTSGTIQVDGVNVMDTNPIELRRRIGYVFQGIGLFPHHTISGNVALIPRMLAWDEERIKKRTTELLELVGLPEKEFGNRLPSQLSGGQRQRVGFARALAAGPKVMLLDEPFGALDPVTRDNLQLEFQSIQRSFGLTAVIVTHDMAEALLLADRIAVMFNGEVLREGSPRDLLANPGNDYVAKLLETPRRHSELLRRIEAGVSQ